jgi:hypothetical protein
MKDRLNPPIDRRNVIRAFAWTSVAAAALIAPAAAVTAAPAKDPKTGRARYQPNSVDVQNYYRVNRYPPK